MASVVYDNPIGPLVRGEEEDNGDCAHGEGYVDGNVSHSFACLLVSFSSAIAIANLAISSVVG